MSVSHPELSSAELERWRTFAVDFRRAQQRLLKQKRWVKRELRLVEQVLREQEPETLSGRYFQIQAVLLEAVFKNLDSLPLAVDVYEHFTALHSVPYLVRDLEITWHRIQMEALFYAELTSFLQRMGDASELDDHWPACFRLHREAWLKQPEAVDKFLQAWERLEEGLYGAREAWREASAQPVGEERLKLLQGMNIPALNGLAYRARGSLKMLPVGETAIQEFRDWMEEGRNRSISSFADQNSLTQRIRQALRKK